MLQVQVINEIAKLQIQVTKEVNDGPAQGTAEYDGQEWAEEAELGVTAAGPARVQEEEMEYHMEPGVDPDGDEPTGADEEWRYFKKQLQLIAEGNKNEKG